ncbi:hypothetical protein I1E95_09355 [Synechococcus sp. CBW1107]|uniref:hypothetical protein n=2 Tax=Synechococcus sp. CBW1107 TaxID=2789857 RepID=UPI0018CF915B|nr:hypothetical protein [Synechococcus sp. CBW1107]QPN58430.1 hypothetical protein I1E95_09355 [Synechococcus sp. CBW1107]
MDRSALCTTLQAPIRWRTPLSTGAMAPRVSLAARSRRVSREDALEELDLATLAQAYRSGHSVYLGRGDFWVWAQDGIPSWLVPRFEDLGFLP